MKTNPLKGGVLTDHSAGLGTVNRKMVRERVVELAVINGRSAQEVSKFDWEQAKWEMQFETGQSLLLEGCPVNRLNVISEGKTVLESKLA